MQRFWTQFERARQRFSIPSSNYQCKRITCTGKSVPRLFLQRLNIACSKGVFSSPQHYTQSCGYVYLCPSNGSKNRYPSEMLERDSSMPRSSKEQRDRL